MKKQLIIIAVITLIGGGSIGFLVFRGISTKEFAENQDQENQYQSANTPPLAESSPPATEEKKTESSAPSSNAQLKNRMHIVTIETNKGVIKFETYNADAPKAVENFITLAEKGFYNGLIFHRIVKGFVMQGGDPDGNGTGGPGYKFEDELNSETESYKEGYKKGVVAMANAGPNTNGSQFFIMLADNPLPHNYTIFGKVIGGQEVVDAIGKVDVDANDRPSETIVMKKVSVEKK